MICKYCGKYFPAINPRQNFCDKACYRKYHKLKGLTRLRQIPFTFIKNAANQANSWLEFDNIIKEAIT